MSMTLTAVRNEIRPLSGYDPRPTLGKITAEEVLADSRYANLPEIIFQVMQYPYIGRFLEENTGFGAFAGALDYRKEGIYYVCPGGKKIKIDFKQGFPIPYKDGRTWYLYNCEENAGFAGAVIKADYTDKEARTEADTKRVEACSKGRILPNYRGDDKVVGNLRGYQAGRKKGFIGKVPLGWFSGSSGIPIDVDADCDSDDFGDRDDVIGCLLSSGSEQISGQIEKEKFANPDFSIIFMRSL
ncbi:MAG: hypothetical protein V1870_02720 [Candidatus Aenigmatarchaeota archaeon]